MSGALPSDPPAPDVSTRTARTGARATKIDWAAAFAALVADPTLGYAGIARRFGVSETAVRKHAKQHDWLDELETERQRLAEELRAQAVRSRQERAAKNVEILDQLDDQLLTKAENGSLDDTDAIRLRADAYRQYLLDIGEATDRIELAEVRQAFIAVATGTDDLLVRVLEEVLRKVLNGKGDVAGRAVLAAFRSEYPKVLELATTSEVQPS